MTSDNTPLDPLDDFSVPEDADLQSETVNDASDPNDERPAVEGAAAEEFPDGERTVILDEPEPNESL